LSLVSSHVSILRCGPGAWNAWRQENPSAVPNLAGIVLDSSERELVPMHGGPINLRGALLRDAVLRFATLTTADLAVANLSGADLAHARLDQANLRAANLSNSCLDYANLDGASLSKLSLRSASLRFASLSGADLEAANLSGANLTHARLNQANLRATNLSNARLDYADFAGANLAKVKLSGANLENAKNLTSAQLAKCTGDESTVLPPHLQGSVPWSPARTEVRTATFAYRDRRKASSGATFNSPRPAGWIAALSSIAALALFGWWQYAPLNLPSEKGADHTVSHPKSLIDSRTSLLTADAPSISILKLVDAPALSIRALDRPELGIVVQPLVPETLSETPLLPSGYAELSRSTAGADGTEITEQRPVFESVRLISPQESNAVTELRGSDEQRREIAAFEPMGAATTFEEASEPGILLVPTISLSQVMPVSGPNEAATLDPVSAPILKLWVEMPALRPLEGSTAPLLGKAAQPSVLASLPLSAKRRDVLRALPPSSEIFLTSVRVPGRPRETKRQNSAALTEGDPLLITVSLNDQMIDVYRGTTLVMTSRVSSGMPDHETKPGVFSILEKQVFHHSNIYSGAPMPWMQRLTRSGTALHAGIVPGYPASHGCVRLPFSFAPKLFKITAVGENVLIAGDRLAPKLIEHRRLFQPSPRPSALAMAQDEQIPWPRSDGSSERPGGAVVLPVVLAKEVGATIGTSEHGPSENPEQVSTSTEPSPSDAMPPAPLRVLVTRRTQRDQMIGLQYTLSAMGYLTRQNFDGTFGKATVAAIVAFQKANGLTETGALNDDLVKKVYAAAGEPEPPGGHLFVRQGFNRVFDAPIALRQPSQALGTHLYTALNFASGDTKIRWIAFSLEGGDSAAVLDRLEIPDEVRQKISENLTPGSSLIVADTSVDSAVLPEGDDFLVWAKEPSSKLEPPHVKQAKVEQRDAAKANPKRATHGRRSVVSRERWSRAVRSYNSDRFLRFDGPRWFSRW
jgi:uncharacterized protein YjbI with pentapeptide repeats/lipoprotein-anchoring transpeptidase ErfK/SrfK